MASKVTIDVEARFTDNVTGQTKAASRAFDDLEKNAREATREVDKLGKKRAEPKVDADTTKATTKVSKVERILAKLGRSKTDVKLSALDKATAIITKVTNKAKAFAGKTYSALVKLRDSNVLSTLSNMSGKLKSFTGKAWSVAVKVKDMATAPLRGIKNMLFSIKSLVVAITAGLAAKALVGNPLNLADSYSSAKIGFSTLLGESAGQQMMDDLDDFAKKTPFKTSGVIDSARKMMAMGWDSDNLLGDLEVFGNAAAATGNLDQGLESIVRAMSQIKTKGRLSTEELNQLAEAGIAAKAMLAEGLGYGTGDEGIAKMTKDLEDGAIASNEAIEALIQGMKKYDGMMDSMANETASGLWSQIQDTFEINVARKWGQGLQDGAKRGLGTVVELLDEADAALSKFGDLMYEIGEKASNWLADKFENAVGRITEITDSFEFQEADFGEKIAMLWKGVVADPLKEWFNDLWTNEENIEKATAFGQTFAENLTKGILAVLGITDIFADTGDGAENKGSNIAQGFAKGFVEGFDVSAITDKLASAIGNVWGALPAWAKILIGGYGVGKAAGGIASFAGGITSFLGGAKNVIGGFNVASSAFPILTASGSGILGGLGKAGVALGASTTGGAILAGSAGIAGGVAGGVSLGKGIYDLYGAYKAKKAGDETEFNAKMASGMTTTSGVALGAGIGAAFGPLGALVGAGLGGVAGWFMGGKAADDIRAAAYESEAMKEAIKDSDKSAEELAQTFAKAKWENAKKHFGDIQLSMTEIARMAEQIVWGDDIGNFEKFSSATKAAEANLQALKTAAEQTDRWMWKASLGVKFNEDEIESIKASFDDYINSAKSFVENKHYEFTAAVGLLVDVKSEGGKSIIDSGNAFYGKIQEQLNDLGGKLSKTVDIALEDGVISLDEQAEITNLQQQIAEITTKIANAEQKAELELIKIKFGNGNLDYESFENFMSTMQTTIDARMAANDDAFVASVSSLNLQLEEGAITQEEYDKQLQTIMDGYTATVEGLQAEVRDVELKIIGDAYSDTLGEDAVADLNNALQYAIDNGLDPIEISDEKMAELLKIDLDENGETISNIKDMLSGTLSQLELLEVDGNLMLKIGEVKTEGDVEEKVKDTLPETVEETVGVNISGEKHIQSTIDILSEDFGIPPEHAATVALLLTGNKELLNKIDVSKLAKEFGIPESQASTIIQKLTGEKSIENRLSILASEFGIPDSISHTIKVNLTAIKGAISNAVGDVKAALGFGGGGFRGGIFGGTSAMGSYARGGIVDDNIPGFSDGGMVRGGSQLIEVAEEGSPEMIIPLSSQRRGRALKLWAQAGHMMGVPGFARGGIIGGDGGSDEGIRFHTFGGGDATGGQDVRIEIGGITFEIHVDGNNSDNITDAIRAQANEIAETVAGIMADAIGGQFENTPLRGGTV